MTGLPIVLRAHDNGRKTLADIPLELLKDIVALVSMIRIRLGTLVDQLAVGLLIAPQYTAGIKRLSQARERGDLPEVGLHHHLFCRRHFRRQKLACCRCPANHQHQRIQLRRPHQILSFRLLCLLVMGSYPDRRSYITDTHRVRL